MAAGGPADDTTDEIYRDAVNHSPHIDVAQMRAQMH